MYVDVGGCLCGYGHVWVRVWSGLRERERSYGNTKYESNPTTYHKDQYHMPYYIICYVMWSVDVQYPQLQTHDLCMMMMCVILV